MAKVMIALKSAGRTETTMIGAKGKVLTDLPKPSGGLGEEMSPTDLLAASLGSCMLSMMAIYAKKVGVDLAGAYCEVDKTMILQPHMRLGRLKVVICVPIDLDEAMRTQFEEQARTCPIHHSLHPEVAQEVTFHWGAKSSCE